MSICEDRPNLAWRRHVTRVAVEIAKYFSFPKGVVKPFKVVTSNPILRRLLFLFASSFALFTPPTCASCSPVVLDLV